MTETKCDVCGRKIKMETVYTVKMTALNNFLTYDDYPITDNELCYKCASKLSKDISKFLERFRK